MAREHVVATTTMGARRHTGHDAFTPHHPGNTDFTLHHLARHSLWNLWLHAVVDVGHHSSDCKHTGQSSISSIFFVKGSGRLGLKDTQHFLAPSMIL